MTCNWLKGVTKADRRKIDEWIAEKYSVAQLWEILSSDPDNPLVVSNTAFRHHLRHHKVLDES